jgi:hypothetical protein
MRAHAVTTIEAIAHDGKLSPLQQALHEEHGLQCGFCTAGIVMSCEAWLRDRPEPDEAAVRELLSGNLCRCTGYQNIVICAGAAGSLASQLSVGDVVVGTETVEHDYRLLFASRPLPRFPGHGPSIDALRRSAHGVSGFQVAFDVIASGDEDVVTSERAQTIRDQTGAACVAWEGSGAARAALFNGIGSLEIRAVTDAADNEAPQRFDANLPIAMVNLASLLRLWLE